MRLTIVIIEYHCMNDVHRCLESVENQLASVEHECIVISNSSYSKQEIEKHKVFLGGGVKLVSSGSNLGYAGGVNSALNIANGEYIYILNPDCRLTDGNVVPLMKVMDDDSAWAISGPKVVDEDGVIQPSCRRFPKPWTFILVRSFFSRFRSAWREKTRYLMEDFTKDEVRSVDWVSGGAILVKSSVLSSVGHMDERYFLYMEDVDWCRTAWGAGYKVMYWPLSTVIHAGQHRSIQAGLHLIFDRHFRWHMVSMAKYFLKFGVNSFPRADF